MDVILQIILAVAPAVLAITLHETAHGFAALALGDDTAKRAGRLSLNPIRHIDRVGTIILPGLLVIMQLLVMRRVEFMFGWAKPVPVNAYRFRDPRRGMMLVAAAGPLTNFVLAWIAAVALNAMTGAPPMLVGEIQLFLVYNLVLGIFNLLPIPPLDGGRIVVGLLPLPLARAWARLERVGIVLVLLLVFVLPRVSNVDPAGAAFGAVIPWALRVVLHLGGHGDADTIMHDLGL